MSYPYCEVHGLAHPCEACAGELRLRDALLLIARMDPQGQRADDLGRAARIAREALQDADGVHSHVEASDGTRNKGAK